MPEATDNSHDVGAWYTRLLRVSLFSVPGVEVPTPDWAEVGGQASENVSRTGTEHTEEGPFGPGRLVMRKVDRRVEWILVAVPSPDSAFRVPPAMPFASALESFLPPLNDWLNRAVQVERIAFGALLIHPAQDLDDAHQKLQHLLRSTQFDLEGVTDFVYQINRPRDSRTVSGLRINRLSKWSVAVWQQIALPIASGGSPAPVTEKVSYDLDLDINTVPRNEALPGGAGAALVKELAEFATEISQNGDIR